MIFEIYEPPPTAASARRPCLFKIHFAWPSDGSTAATDEVHRSLVAERGCVLVAVNLSQRAGLSFDRSVEACYAILRWMRCHAGLFDLDVAAFGIAGEDCGCSIAASLAERIVERAEFAMSFLYLSRPFAAESLWMPRVADLGWSPLLAPPSRHDPLYCDGPTSSARLQPVPSTFISTRPLQEFVRITLGMSRDAEPPAPQQDAEACPLIVGMRR